MPKPFSSIPGPKGLPFIGSVLDYSRVGQYSFELMHEAKRCRLQQYGKLYKELLGRHIVQLFDPADVETVFRSEARFPRRPPLPIVLVGHQRDGEPIGLGTLNGEAWWKVRKAVQRIMLHPSAATVYLPVQNIVADDMLRLVEHQLHENNNNNNSGELTDLIGIISRYTMEAFGAVCFGTRIGCLHHHIPPGSDAYTVMAATSRMLQAVQKTSFSFPWFALFRTPMYRQYLQASRTCHGIARTYVNEALNVAHHTLNNDNIWTGHDPSSSHCPNFLSSIIAGHSEQLTAEQLVGLAIDLFTAGIDSTAFALSFLMYNLARNPDKQDRLYAEIDQVLPNCAAITAESLSKLSYLKACVKESFRLNFPVEGGTIRELEKGLILSDYHVPKGTLVALNCQTMCLQEEYFHNPERYVPERWLKPGSAALRINDVATQRMERNETRHDNNATQRMERNKTRHDNNATQRMLQNEHVVTPMTQMIADKNLQTSGQNRDAANLQILSQHCKASSETSRKDNTGSRSIKHDDIATFRSPPNFVMLPFGYGARMCIGRRFAEQELYLAIVKKKKVPTATLR